MSGKGISRRGLLGGAALALGGAAFGGVGALSRLARAAAAPTNDGVPDRYYIFCYFGGGWDILLGLDPRNPGVFSSNNVATTRIQPAYDQVNNVPVSAPYQDVLGDGSMFLGPFVGELAQKADKLCVVRGLSMDTVTHEVGRRRFLTGKPPSGLTARGSSTDAWFASRLGAQAPIPNLSIRVESYNTGELPNFATALQTNGIDDLLRVLSPAGPSLDSLEERQLDLLLAHTAACPDAERSALWRASETSRAKAQEMVTQGLSSLFDFRSNSPEMQALRDFYGINGTSTTAMRSSAAMAAMASTAIMSGVSRAVSVQITSRSLDTHFTNWATDQGPTQMEAFNAIARMMTHLESTPHPDGSGDSWLDRTTIVGFSEFSRTPLMNNNGGRDHWLVNSCLLAGGGIAGGKVVGASSNIGMNPLPVNLETGQPCATDETMAVACPEDDEVEVIRPEHILQALYHEIGMRDDPADLRVKPLSAIMKG